MPKISKKRINSNSTDTDSDHIHCSSSTSSDSELEWVEQDAKPDLSSLTHSTEKFASESRTTNFEDFGYVLSRRDTKMLHKRQHKEKCASQDKPGCHDRELNPYWKDGGSGLPTQGNEHLTDNNSSWLNRAINRLMQQAKDEKRTMEEIIIERWGSLANWKKIINQDTSKSEISMKLNQDTSVLPTSSIYQHNVDDYDDSKKLIRGKALPLHLSRKLPGWKSKDFVSQDPLINSSKQIPKQPVEIIPPQNIFSIDNEDAPKICDINYLNKLNAKLLKAEILNNKEQINELQNKIKIATESISQEVVGQSVNSTETEIPVKSTAARAQLRGIGHNTSTFDLSIQDMISQEKLLKSSDGIVAFERLSAAQNVDEDFTVDDAILSKARKRKHNIEQKNIDYERQKAIKAHRSSEVQADICSFCIENASCPKSTIVAVGLKCYLCVPIHQSLVEDHCYIVPMSHVSCSTLLDVDVWQELQVWRKGLTAMFRTRNEDCIFMETAVLMHKRPHMIIECVPLPQEAGDMAPIYFKKAILECEGEWLQNKRLIDLKDSNVRKSIPAGFPYFSVDFGLQSGYAHVIEDEKSFPLTFGKEILAGILELDYHLWRKPKIDSIEIQRTKRKSLLERWTPFDWTEKVKSALS